MKPIVSILIAAYNAEAWIAETLESALAQTWQNQEIIVVDDGSTDNSLQIAKSFESNILKVISQENCGASAARNCALKAAQGDFIQYLDADDLLAPNKIGLQLNMLLNENSDCIATGEWARFYKTPSEALFFPQPVWSDKLPVDWLICSWEGGGMMHPAAWLVPRQIAEIAGSWDETLSLNDDGEYFCRVILASKEVKFCWGAKTYYRSGISNSLSGRKSPDALESAFRSVELSTNHLLAQENSQRTRAACASAFQSFVYDVYPDMPELVQKAEAHVQSLGGSNMLPQGGFMFQLLSKVVGWKQTKITQRFIYSYLKR